MADNVAVTEGSGKTIATDEVSSVQHQLVKLEFGTDGNATMVSSSNPLPVDGSGVTQPVSAASLPLPSGASTAANQSTIISHVDGIETILGTIDSDTSTLAGAVDGTEMQVDVLTLPTLSNVTTVGTVSSVTAIANALPAGTNNIGDVDVLSVPRSQSGPGEPGTAIDSYNTIAINLSAGNNQVLVSSAANKQIWVYGIVFTLSANGTVSFQDEDDTAITGVMNFAQYSGLNSPPRGNFSMPMWKLATDKDLEVDLVTADLDGSLCYAIVSV